MLISTPYQLILSSTLNTPRILRSVIISPQLRGFTYSFKYASQVKRRSSTKLVLSLFADTSIIRLISRWTTKYVIYTL